MLAGFACAAGVLLWFAWGIHRANRFIDNAAGDE